MIKKLTIAVSALFFAGTTYAGAGHHHHADTLFGTTKVLIGIDILNDLEIKPLLKDEALGVAYAELDSVDLIEVHDVAHEYGRCGGYTIVKEESDTAAINNFSYLRKMKDKNLSLIHI